jgi:hypothetical protein
MKDICTDTPGTNHASRKYSYSEVTLHSAYNDISNAKSIELLY